MDLWSNFIDIVVLGVGVYLIYLIWKAKTTGEIHQTFIWRRPDDPRKCRDKEGFVNYLFPRVIICGVILILNGGFGIINRRAGILGIWDLLSIGVTIIAIILFGIFDSKAMKLYFD